MPEELICMSKFPHFVFDYGGGKHNDKKQVLYTRNLTSKPLCKSNFLEVLLEKFAEKLICRSHILVIPLI